MSLLLSRYADKRMCRCGLPVERLGREWIDSSDVIRFEPEPVVSQYVSTAHGSREVRHTDAGSSTAETKVRGSDRIQQVWCVTYTHLCEECGIMPFAATHAASTMPPQCYVEPKWTPHFRQAAGEAIRSGDLSRVATLVETYRKSIET